ncbi:NUDIX hydrolase [Cohaesibacter celericrescens]|uniref:NUDIX hydrolase n=1 Tax=Cohaesibacter celericrescens TaxID=2067669 RepID=A0A2N5XTC2_9HYPH|nr:NUDIX hydrolase [Cohaesibacter celericrescens]
MTANAANFHDKNQPTTRPKDAATLIILDREHAEPKILMGRRHMKHRFMPGKFVFPGGRLDATDRFVPYASDLHPHVMEKLRYQAKNGNSDTRMRALVMCAVRETYEEAGLFLGTKGTDKRLKGGDWEAFKEREILPNLAPFRFIARAVTPPGRTRRFDTRFFAVDSAHIAARLPEETGPTGELEDLHWLTIPDACNLDLPRITLEILTELEARLIRDPDFTPKEPTPYFYMIGKSMVRAEI